MISLPEERARLVQTSGLDAEPISLSIDDDVVAADRVRAHEVYMADRRFTAEERDRILARLALGL